MKGRLRILAIVAVLILVGSGLIYGNQIVGFVGSLPIINKLFRPTIDSQIAKYGAAAHKRLEPAFARQQIPYPPEQVMFLAIKASKELEVYCKSSESKYQYVCTYPILGASGHLGPKLREGDRQVPEGIYRLSLEPNTPYHLALRLNYPNEMDLARAKTDGRANPGSDILIHGSTGSIGCLAMGDEASEDLFVLVYDAKDKNTELIIAPVDLRDQIPPAPQATDPSWLPTLYNEIKNKMTTLPKKVAQL